MNKNNPTARWAGLLYLIVIICGTFYLQYIPSTIRSQNKNLSYAENLISSPALLKSGIATEILCWIAFLLLALMFYRLFKPVNQFIAGVMITFAAVQVPIAFLNLSNKLSVLHLIQEGILPNTINTDQALAQIKWALENYQNGNQLNHVFWGLWLLPLGYLVIRSGFLPKFIGFVLITGCFGYLIDFFGSLFNAAYANSALSDYSTLPAGIGEIGICLWLLVAGVKPSRISTVIQN
ncbi:DUF4386 domain-containing protein [Mucilaginibacter sp. CAU 1740]|uniref:DUF4386 domain-containing protein n=1 Tax=Mucilaginibacter sp. CAU 1740 TaxID=3140365 RepID=UPI00325BB3CD